MATQTATNRTEHLLALMKQADDAFNRRDLDAMDALHHPEVVCYVTGSHEPTSSLPPHHKVVEDVIRAFPSMSTTTPTQSSSARAPGPPSSAR